MRSVFNDLEVEMTRFSFQPLVQTLRRLRAAALAGSLMVGAVASAVVPSAAWARGESEASAVSSGLSIGVPVASAAATSLAVLASGVVLTVVAVQASTVGTVWVMESLADGSRFVVRLSQDGADASRIAIGTALAVTVLSTGWVLSAAGQAVCFVPNAQGRALLHHEKVSL